MSLHRRFLMVWVIALTLAACTKGGAPGAGAAKEPTQGAAAAASAPVLLLSAEDLRTVALGGAGVAGGPVITGSVEPEKRADLRAEVPAVVTQVLKENGEAVRKGDLLVRLDDTAIRESLQSADASARAAAQAFEQAERQVQRLKTLQGQGMTSIQALEDAEVRRNSAQSELAAARSRVASAQQQLRRTEVRAPFDGVVSERKASVGDTAQIGKELVKVIDPSSMRFEGLVSADRMHEIKVGQAVSFSVNGFPEVVFGGNVRRIDATANATTRQVELIVDFADRAKAPPRGRPLRRGPHRRERCRRADAGRGRDRSRRRSGGGVARQGRPHRQGRGAARPARRAPRRVPGAGRPGRWRRDPAQPGRHLGRRPADRVRQGAGDGGRQWRRCSQRCQREVGSPPCSSPTSASSGRWPRW